MRPVFPAAGRLLLVWTGSPSQHLLQKLRHTISHSTDGSGIEVTLPYDIHFFNYICHQQNQQRKMQAWSSFTKGSFLSMYIQIYQLYLYVNKKVVCINQKLQLSEIANIITDNQKIQGEALPQGSEGSKASKLTDAVAEIVVTSLACDSQERGCISKGEQARSLARNSTGMLISSKNIIPKLSDCVGGLKKHVIYYYILLGFFFCALN